MKTRKYLGIVFELISKTDITIEVLDCRFPKRCRWLEKKVIGGGKKIILVLTKADLVNEAEKLEIRSKTDVPFVFFSAKTREGKSRLKRLIQAISKNKDTRVCVVGYPNVGKSSLINTLCGRRAASTSPVPGHTKNVQWVRVGRIMLMDTPGVIPSTESEEDLMIKNELDVDATEDPVPAAIKLVKLFNKKRSMVFFEFYGVEHSGDVESIITAIGKKRGKLLKGGEVNISETAKMIIRDWQRGKIRF